MTDEKQTEKKPIEKFSSCWFEMAAIKILTDRDPDQIVVMGIGSRKEEAVARYFDSTGLPTKEEMKMYTEEFRAVFLKIKRRCLDAIDAEKENLKKEKNNE